MFVIFWCVIFGLIGTAMAQNRDRNMLAGFIGGALFGFFACIYYWIVGDSENKKKEKVRAIYAEIEREKHAKD